ncbi:MAG: Zn-dependent exopeptidase M28 [Actinobacteria bacterium]|nr:MAG: Zn-dependent exopeptidase M28 [Actinomycetota bacterium]
MTRSHHRAARLSEHLARLCAGLADRHTGGPGNIAANEYFADVTTTAGLAVERIAFDCFEWEPGPAELTTSSETLTVKRGPYTLPCNANGVLLAATTLEELESLDAPGAILVLHGALAAEPLTPRGYPFYEIEAHARILSAIEAARPAAIIAVTGRDTMAGAVYPFPLVNDASVDVPSAYTRDVDGPALLAHVGETVRFRMDAKRIPTRAEQVIARKPGTGEGRIIVSAHIDTARETPGALDNGTGVACLLGLAEELAGRSTRHTVEIVPFNGEDNYAARGELVYLAANPGGFDDVTVVVNIDAAGLSGAATDVSFYGCPDAVRAAAGRAMAPLDSVQEGPQWPASDHMVFAMKGIPAMAIASAELARIAGEIAHTAADTPDLADPALMDEIVTFLLGFIEELDAIG